MGDERYTSSTDRDESDASDLIESRNYLRRTCMDIEDDEYRPTLNPTWVPTERREFFDALPGPAVDDGTVATAESALSPQWNSVALFFNLPSSNQPDGYAQTSVADAKEWLDEGAEPASPSISEFMSQYFDTLSYGNLSFGVDTPRDGNGEPLVPMLSGGGGWKRLINRCLDANPEAIWEAAGGLTRNGKRWIPSVVLVENYNTDASADFGGYDRTIDGETYRIGDRTHVQYELESHATETVGYAAVGNASGADIAGQTSGVTDSWSTINFGSTFGSDPVVVPTIQTYNGYNTAGIRLKDRSRSSVDIKLEEEQSLNAETSHVEETVGYLAVDPGPISDDSGRRIGEAGTITTDQADGTEWHTVETDGSYSEPVVLMQLLTHNGGHPSHTRLRNVEGDSFTFQIEEWDYLNQTHKEETIGYIVLARGSHQLPDGTTLDVGTVDTDHTWTSVSVASSGQAPVAVSHAQTRDGRQSVVTRQRNVTTSGFDVRLQEEERNQRLFWAHPLAHEYAHNFLEFGDLYGPQGATLYWDLLGDGAKTGVMSEVSSVHKERVGWMSFNETVEGSTQSGYTNQFSLAPYTTSGDAIKVVPDPEHNPHEYFVIEYRTSTGDEPWRPSGALEEKGLFIAHINERLLTLESGEDHPGGLSYFNSVAPYFDPEVADYSDNGRAMRGIGRDGVLFTGDSGRDRFGPETKPSSDFYGGRSSTLSVWDLSVTDDEASFWLSLDPITHRRLWTVGDADRGVAGQFRSSDPDAPDEIFFRNDNEAALLTHSETTWLVRSHQAGRIDGWNLGSGDRERAGDLDGDGRDEVYIRSDNWAGVFQWGGDRFEVKGMTSGRVGGWNLGANDRELVADLDGDGREEIYVRSNNWAGVIEWSDGLSLRTITDGSVGNWQLGAEDTERVGQFTGADGEEIVVLGADGLGLLRLEQPDGSLTSVSVQRGSIGSWSLEPTDRLHVGDFDGDGRDELYLRKDNRAGVLKWSGSGFEVAWQRRNGIRGNYNANRTLSLTADDTAYTGQFLPATEGGSHRDGVFHLVDDRISLLVWDDATSSLRVESFENGSWFEWEGQTELILGDFHPVGQETAKGKQFIPDEGTDAFLHNRWGTGTIGVDIYKKDNGPADTRAPSVFWRQQGYLMSQYEPSLAATVRNAEPVDPETSVEFVGAPRGVENLDAWSIDWEYQDPDDNWHAIGTSDPGEVLSYDGLPDEQTGTGTEGWEVVRVRARATHDGTTLSEELTVEFATEGPRTYVRNSVATNSGYLSEDGTVTSAADVPSLRVGDDAANNSMQAMLTFELDLPDGVTASDIQEATLSLVLQPPEGSPYDDLSDLVVVHADYGDSIDPSDLRSDSLTFRPGRSVVSFDEGWGDRQVDVTRAVRNAWEDRESRGDRVQFVIYHRRGTDSDTTPDYTKLAAEAPANSSHNSLLRVTYTTDED